MENENVTQKGQDADRKEMTADLYTLVIDVLKNLWAAVAVGIAAALLVYVAASLRYVPQYRSSTTFVVSARGTSTGAYANVSAASQKAEVFQTVLDSQVLKNRVAGELGLQAFEGTVDISIVPETNLLSVSVTAGSPEMAYRLLRTMLDIYPEVSRSVMGDVVLEIFENPNYPTAPVRAFQSRSIMKRAFAAGTLLTAALFALLSYMRDTVKTEKQAAAKLDAPLFAAVYHESRYKNLKSRLLRRKKKIWITEPSVSFGFEETMRKIRTKFLYQHKKNGGKVLAVTSTVPEEGKTTLAVNLAIALAQDEKKCC